VVVVHDQPMIRLGIAAMLASTPDIELVAHGDTAEVIPQTETGDPELDVVVVPVPEGDRPPLVDDLAGRVPLLAVSGSGPDDRIDLPVGFLGWVAADVTVDELVAAIRAVAARRPYRSGSSPDPTGLLSPREREALLLIGQGLTHHQVARRMGVAKSTVETYVERIRDKLCLGNKAELTRAALRLRS
jgi:DNA-binding NarL/FixJ family response regulator